MRRLLPSTRMEAALLSVFAIGYVGGFVSALLMRVIEP